MVKPLKANQYHPHAEWQECLGKQLEQLLLLLLLAGSSLEHEHFSVPAVASCDCCSVHLLSQPPELLLEFHLAMVEHSTMTPFRTWALATTAGD